MRVGAGRIAFARRFMNAAIASRVTAVPGQYPPGTVAQPLVTPRFFSHSMLLQNPEPAATSVNGDGPEQAAPHAMPGNRIAPSSAPLKHVMCVPFFER